MYKFVLLFFISILIFNTSCKSHKLQQTEKTSKSSKKKEKKKTNHKPTLAELIAKTITSDDLDYHVYSLTSDSMRGRKNGSS